ncbi:MAG TPA: hypothetical protein VFX97_03460 [Pyrinomonadaceae bacterium]|nr:hypothetical protein [Pyrinomonadaceae bacterium]
MNAFRGAVFTIGVCAVLFLPAFNVHGQDLPIAPNTKLSVELLSPISTVTNKKGDKFSCKILMPAEYAGAIVEGRIRNLKHSGKANKDSHIDLAFDTVTLVDGRNADFTATVVEVFDVVNVANDGRADNEGTVRSRSTTVKTSVKRAAVGALIGGVIGGALAGGKGAVIGAAIGAGVGATTTLATRGPDLAFKQGTQFTIVCNGPTRKRVAQGPVAAETNDAPILAPPDPPSLSYRVFTADLFSISIPDNWRDHSTEALAIFAPERGYRALQGRPELTHGVMVGSIRVPSATLDAASAEYVGAVIKGNPHLAPQGPAERTTLADREAVRILLTGAPNGSVHKERVIVYNLSLSDGRLFYVNVVAPATESAAYHDCFESILKSIKLNNQ